MRLSGIDESVQNIRLNTAIEECIRVFRGNEKVYLSIITGEYARITPHLWVLVTVLSKRTIGSLASINRYGLLYENTSLLLDTNRPILDNTNESFCRTFDECNQTIFKWDYNTLASQEQALLALPRHVGPRPVIE
jgi:hypothetical protein